MTRRLLSGGLTAILGLLCVGQLLCWLPHYLTWPYWCDHDVFAAMAQSWDAGVLPYREFQCNNLPGQTYVFWMLGKVFGWGRTVPFYVFDSILLLALGCVILLWSRRLFTSLLPGLVGFAAILTYYLDCDYALTAQRDWQAGVFWVIGLLSLQAWPGKAGLVVGALGFAIALTFRPQVILLVPAYLTAIESREIGSDRRMLLSLRSLCVWSLLVMTMTTLAFVPLIVRGLIPDLIQSVRNNAVGPGYSAITPPVAIVRFLLEISPLKIVSVPVIGFALSTALGRAERRLVGTWSLALIGALGIYSLSPRQHLYLMHPVWLAWSINLGVLAALIQKHETWPDLAKVSGLVLLLGLGVSVRPRFCQPVYCLEAVMAITRGVDPERNPLGYLYPAYSRVPTYAWSDYHALITYLRHECSPDTKIANLIGVLAVASPSGHLTALPAESTSWLIAVNPKAEQTFATAIENATNTLVVWVPENPPTEQERAGLVSEVVRRCYDPEAKFGLIEVWKQKAE